MSEVQQTSWPQPFTPGGLDALPPPAMAHLTWGRFFWADLLPVTTGKLIGGVVLVGAVYWFVYLRPRRLDPTA